MCGFAGFLQQTSVIASSAMTLTVRRMAGTLQHRGPDDAGAWIDPQAGIALGHQRLSIIDLSAEGHQPMASVSGRYVIAFNGEIYNFQDLRKDLHDQVPTWRGHSDTEVMLAAFEHWGVEKSLQRFNGMFAFALWDRDERLLHLARDRLGEKPLYYGWMGQTLLFGSELKALRAHPDWRGEVDRNALAAYLRHSYVPAPHSIYRGISKLPPGTYLTVSTDQRASMPAPSTYWSMQRAAEAGVSSPLQLGEEAAIDELERLLLDAVKLRMVADVPVGVFLSGGVDSSTVVALMQAQSQKPVKSFSIGFNEEGYNEAQFAKQVARHLHTDHTELYVTPAEAIAVIPTLAEIYDEPFSDSSQIPTVLVSKLARQQVTVSLSGDGGDEFFCGYIRYFWGRRIWNKLRHVPYPVRNIVGAGMRGVSTQTWDSVIRRSTRLMPSNSLKEITGDRLHKLADVLSVPSSEALYQGLISHWDRPEAIVHGSREPASVLSDSSQWGGLSDFTQRMMFLDSVSYLPDDILVKVDRASMSVGLESRVPLLDHRLVEFAWRVPLSMKIRGQHGKWLLRQVLYRHVPRELIERPKMGFGVPIDSWLRGPLRDWAEDLLSARRLQHDGYFDPAPIRAKWAEHLSGARNWQYWLWDILMFQAWLDQERRDTAVRAEAAVA